MGYKSELNSKIEIDTFIGMWYIDKILGKKLVRITIIKNNAKLTNIPSHSKIYDLLNQILAAEFDNDTFEFIHPKIISPSEPNHYDIRNGRHYRSAKFLEKIEEIEKLVQRWKWLGQSEGLIPPNNKEQPKLL